MGTAEKTTLLQNIKRRQEDKAERLSRGGVLEKSTKKHSRQRFSTWMVYVFHADLLQNLPTSLVGTAEMFLMYTVDEPDADAANPHCRLEDRAAK